MQIEQSLDAVNTSHVIRMTRMEAIELAGHLIKMVGCEMRINDHDESGVYIPPPPCSMIGENYKVVMFSMHKG
jgi:hypothetical protein